MVSTWRYAVTVTDVGQERVYEIREVYYFAGALSWTKDPISPSGESWSEVCHDLELMASDAGTGEVLNITDQNNPFWEFESLTKD